MWEYCQLLKFLKEVKNQIKRVLNLNFISKWIEQRMKQQLKFSSEGNHRQLRVITVQKTSFNESFLKHGNHFRLIITSNNLLAQPSVRKQITLRLIRWTYFYISNFSLKNCTKQSFLLWLEIFQTSHLFEEIYSQTVTFKHLRAFVS